MLEVRLLGQFDVQRDGTPVVMPSRLAQSIFAYLVLTAGSRHRRERLAGLFWPDTTEEIARRNLRQELWRLRKAIESKGTHHRATTYFQVDEVTIAFEPHSDFWLDAAILATPQVDRASTSQLIDQLALYRGELLPGFYEEWVLLERERVRSIFEQKMARLVDRLVAEQRWDAVLEWGERWIALGQVPEPSYRALMIAHSALGDRSKVAAVFERCTQALQETLQVEPSPQTRALFAQLSRDNSVVPAAPLPSAPLVPQPPAINLPVPLTRFIGRERESSEVKDRLSTTRLLTLTGSGGVGKTRLAIQVAAEFSVEFNFSTWWVALAALTDGDLVVQQVASSLRVREIPLEPLEETLTNYLSAKHTLLVWDNCEHLVNACAQLAQTLLSRCPNLKILATSREALGITGEVIWRVPSLSVPAPQVLSSTVSALSFEGVRLFVDRAQAANTAFQLSEQNVTAVVQICRRLDGIPLAIELAAARIHVLAIDEIAARLDDRFGLLTSGSRTALPRHQTLRALVDWSYELLSDPERVLWRRLAVFAGGFTLDAVGALCTEDGLTGPRSGIKSIEALDLLAKLVAKSLVVVEQPEPQRRFNLLETMRQYAQDRLLESGEKDRVGHAHLNYFLRLAREAEPHIQDSDPAVWIGRLEIDHDNLHAALRWAIDSNSAEAALRLACHLSPFWYVRGYLGEARSSLGDVLSMSTVREPQCASLRARTLYYAGVMAFHQSDFTAARSLSKESLLISETLGDKESISSSLSYLGLVAWVQGDYTPARALCEKVLVIRRELGDKRGIGWALIFLGMVMRELGDYATARALMEESLILRRELGEPLEIADGLLNTGATASAQGDPVAVTLLEEALSIFEKLGDRLNVARCLHDLAVVDLRQGNPAVARSRFATALVLFREVGDNRNAIKCLEGLGGVYATEGRADKAARLLGASEALRRALGSPLPTSYRADYDRNMAAVRRQLDETTLAAGWAAGHTLTIAQAVAYALEGAKDVGREV